MIWYSYFIDYWAIRLCAFVIPLHYLALTHFLSISACGIFLLKSLFPIINLFFYIWRNNLFYPDIVLNSSIIFFDMSANGLYSWSRTSWWKVAWFLYQTEIPSYTNQGTFRNCIGSLIYPKLEKNCAKIRSFVMYVIYELSLWVIQ